MTIDDFKLCSEGAAAVLPWWCTARPWRPDDAGPLCLPDVVDTGPSILTVVTAIAAIAAAAMSWWAGHRSTRQRERQASREGWWRRFQWATEMATSGEDAKARVGVTLLAALTDSPLATRDELDALSSITNDIVELYLAPLQRMGDGDDDAAANGNPGQEVARMTVQTPQIATMAARLRMKIDRKRGIETPLAIRKLTEARELSQQDIEDARQAAAIS